MKNQVTFLLVSLAALISNAQEDANSWNPSPAEAKVLRAIQGNWVRTLEQEKPKIVCRMSIQGRKLTESYLVNGVPVWRRTADIEISTPGILNKLNYRNIKHDLGAKAEAINEDAESLHFTIQKGVFTRFENVDQPGAPNALVVFRKAADGSGRYEQYAKGIFDRYDKNEDGALDEEEMKLMRRPPLNADTNQDGSISKDEFIQSLQGRSGNSRRDPAPPRSESRQKRFESYARSLMTKYDRNEDGELSAAEMKMMRRPLNADTNQDGVIRLEELIRSLKGPALVEENPVGNEAALPEKGNTTGGYQTMKFVEQTIKTHDENQDGELTRDEFGSLAAPLRKADTNEDGVITRGELIDFARKDR